jgi:hypothetical protein
MALNSCPIYRLRKFPLCLVNFFPFHYFPLVFHSTLSSFFTPPPPPPPPHPPHLPPPPATTHPTHPLSFFIFSFFLLLFSSPSFFSFLFYVCSFSPQSCSILSAAQLTNNPSSTIFSVFAYMLFYYFISSLFIVDYLYIIFSLFFLFFQ